MIKNRYDFMKRFNFQCVCCGKVLAMDKNAHAHHLRSYSKTYNLSRCPKAEYDKEASKCVLMCAECHKALHKAIGRKCFKKDSLNFIAGCNK